MRPVIIVLIGTIVDLYRTKPFPCLKYYASNFMDLISSVSSKKTWFYTVFKTTVNYFFKTRY